MRTVEAHARGPTVAGGTGSATGGVCQVRLGHVKRSLLSSENMEDTTAAPPPQPGLRLQWMGRRTAVQRRSVATLHRETQTQLTHSLTARRRGTQVVKCALLNIMGSTFPTGVLHGEPDIERSPVTDQQDSDEEESPCVAPELFALSLKRHPSRSGLLDLGHGRAGGRRS